jgi:inorganic triphosphatase YgiF
LSKHTETELKLSCTDESVWEKILTAEALRSVVVPGSEGTQQLEARYFDTPSHALQKAKLAYRLRLEAGTWIATVKGGGSSKGGLHARMEWNIPVLHGEPDIEVFSHTDIGAQLQEVVGDEILEPILITSFERRTIDVVMPDGSTIEVAADRGAIIAGEKTAPILEIELELKTGRPGALFLLGAALAKEYPLLPEPDSKFYRGLLLAGLSAEIPKKSELPLPQVDKTKPIGEALSALLIELIAQILVAQRAFLENPEQPERTYELRVCLRRLRSVLAFAEPLAVIKQHVWYQDELRKLGQKMASLRQLDVAFASWQQLVDFQIPGLNKKVWLGDILTETRNQEMENIAGECKAGLATSLLLNLWAELLDKDWQQLITYDHTAEEYVVNNVASWLKKVRKEEETVEWTDIESIHNLRLGIKKLRYVAEVMQPILTESARLVEQLARLQDILGVIVDAHGTEVLLRTLLREKSSRAVHLEAGMLIGWQVREQLSLQKKLEKSWKKFNRIAKKWKS